MAEKFFRPDVPQEEETASSVIPREIPASEPEQKTVLENIRGMDRRAKTFVKALSLVTMLSGKSDSVENPESIRSEERQGRSDWAIPKVSVARRVHAISREGAQRLIDLACGDDVEMVRLSEAIINIPGGKEVIADAVERLFRRIEQTDVSNRSRVVGREIANLLNHPNAWLGSQNFTRYISLLSEHEQDMTLPASDWASSDDLLDVMESVEDEPNFGALSKLYLEMIAQKNQPLVMIEHVEVLKKTELGQKMLDDAVKSLLGGLTSRELETLSRHFPSVGPFIREPYGRDLLTLISERNENTWLSALQEIRSVLWGTEFIQQRTQILFDNDPALFLSNIDGLRRFRPDLAGKDGIRACVGKLFEKGDTENLLRYSSLFVREPYAEKILDVASGTNPAFAIGWLFQAVPTAERPSWLSHIQERTIRMSAVIDPRALISEISNKNVGNKPFMKDIMMTLARTNPDLLTQSYWQYKGYYWSDDAYKTAMENAIESHSESVIVALGSGNSREHLPNDSVRSFFDRAMRNDPSVVID